MTIMQFWCKKMLSTLSPTVSICNCPSVSLCAASDVVLGDGLVLLSAILYAVSNVCQEYTVKNLSRVDFLGMMGLFGTVISGIQL